MAYICEASLPADFTVLYDSHLQSNMCTYEPMNLCYIVFHFLCHFIAVILRLTEDNIDFTDSAHHHGRATDDDRQQPERCQSDGPSIEAARHQGVWRQRERWERRHRATILAGD